MSDPHWRYVRSLVDEAAERVDARHAAHEYVGSGERCRLCNLTANHIIHDSDPEEAVGADWIGSWQTHGDWLYGG